jgi:CxxC motif-containing protein
VNSEVGSGGCCNAVEHTVYSARSRLPRSPWWDGSSVTAPQREVRDRIQLLVESVKGDPVRSNELFQYVWTMMCVRRGLLRVVREVTTRFGDQVVLEEVSTGNHRLVSRPYELDSDVESLAVQALARILEGVPPVA